MSFPIVCSSCGAESSPSVGACPFCKTIQSSATQDQPENATLAEIQKFYAEGNLDMALAMATTAETIKPDLLRNISFVVLYTKILIETEAPSSKSKVLLTRAMLELGESSELAEWFEIVTAKSQLSRGNDIGEMTLKNIFQRSPHNGHAAFLLGAHVLWVEERPGEALPILERAVRECPNFLRANACLAAAYQQLDFEHQAKSLFKRCYDLEKNETMRAYFKKLT